MLSKPGWILRIEGVVVFLVSVMAYRELGGRWPVFFLLFLWPDLLMLGYAVNVRAGASLYNLVHTEVGPLLLGAAAVFWSWHTAFLFALIWLAHVSFDRMLGYGLKYPTFFKDTHLQRVLS